MQQHHRPEMHSKFAIVGKRKAEDVCANIVAHILTD